MARPPKDSERADSPESGRPASWIPEPDSTVRILAASMEAASLAVLRGALTLPPTGGDDFGELGPRIDTPRTTVLSTVVRADRGTLTTMAGPTAGETVTLAGSESILGRDATCEVLVDDASVSRRHARITRDDRAHHFVEDLGSRNGTFVNGRRVRRASLRTGDRLQLGRDSIYRFAVVDEEEEEFQRRLYDASMRDTLTHALNRRTLFERLAGEVSHAERTGGELALLLLDLDHFRAINDKLGHPAGDEALKAIVLAGAEAVRAGDILARYGGDEFVVLAREAGQEEAFALAERLRASVASVRLGDGKLGVTASVGLVTLAECSAAERADGGKGLLARADQRLQLAKIGGRDAIVASD